MSLPVQWIDRMHDGTLHSMAVAMSVEAKVLCSLNCEFSYCTPYTQGDSDLISFHIYASWFCKLNFFTKRHATRRHQWCRRLYGRHGKCRTTSVAGIRHTGHFAVPRSGFGRSIFVLCCLVIRLQCQQDVVSSSSDRVILYNLMWRRI